MLTASKTNNVAIPIRENPSDQQDCIYANDTNMTKCFGKVSPVITYNI